MLRLRKIAITGGLACGKTAVCRILRKLGATVVSADDIVHQLLSPDTPIGKKVIDLIGTEIIENNTINRSKLAKRVFNQPELLKSLEEILHPAVKEEIEKQYLEAQNQGDAALFVAEIPLLFESRTHFPFDAVVAVIADADTCQERFKQKSGQDTDEWIRRMQEQIDPAEKAARADFVIINNGSLEETEEQVKILYQQLTGD